jgi:hypothetical protein
MYNQDQQAYRRYLASLAPDDLCDCRWATRGACFGSCVGDASKGGFVTAREGKACPSGSSQ